MPEADPGSGLRTLASMARYQLKNASNPVVIACLRMAVGAIDLAVAAEREGPQVSRRERRRTATQS